MTPTLDALIERARTSEVRDDGHALVAELDRWATRRPEPRRWPVWFGGGVLAAAAAAAIFFLWPRASTPVSGAPLQLGGRVAIVSDPGTDYRVIEASDAATEVVVERGAITARLWSGDAAHRLVLRGGDVVATASGTVYTLSVDDGVGAVFVHEGAVTVRAGAEETRVAAGAS
ncbi:MAG: hypothetical protein K8M05_23830, partial [Deltaproteobacteria bacterium]|nr:hypothetical protein [Kofleriaceae bacterium]